MLYFVQTNIIKRLALSIYVLFSCLSANGEAISHSITIPFDLENGLIIIEASINEEKGSFILDTGSDALVINGSSSSESNIALSTVHGEVNVGEIEVSSLEIGSIRHNNVKAFLSNLSSLESFTSTKLKGIIGGKFFVPNTIHINYNTKNIVISSDGIESIEQSFDHQLPFIIQRDVPCVKINKHGKDYWVALDSGSTSHFIDKAFINVLGNSLIKSNQTVQVLNAGNDATESQRFILDELNFGSKTYAQVNFISQDLGVLNKELKKDIVGIISLSALGESQILIDLENNLILF